MQKLNGSRIANGFEEMRLGIHVKLIARNQIGITLQSTNTTRLDALIMGFHGHCQIEVPF